MAILKYQPQAPAAPHDWKYNLKHSEWAGSIWEWFQELAGHIADPFLVVSFVWAGLKLYRPEIAANNLGWDIFINAAQFVALDAAGIALGTIATHVEKLGNVQGALKARKISKTLRWLMLATLALAIIQLKFGLSGIVLTFIESGILLYRAYMSLEYTALSHELRQYRKNHAQAPNIEIETLLSKIDSQGELLKNERASIEKMRIEIETEKAKNERIRIETENITLKLKAQNETLKAEILKFQSENSLIETSRSPSVSISELKNSDKMKALGAENRKRIAAPKSGGASQLARKYIETEITSGRQLGDITVSEIKNETGVSIGTASNVYNSFKVSI